MFVLRSSDQYSYTSAHCCCGITSNTGYLQTINTAAHIQSTIKTATTVCGGVWWIGYEKTENSMKCIYPPPLCCVCVCECVCMCGCANTSVEKLKSLRKAKYAE